MPIDPKQVQWDAPDASSVKWDDEPVKNEKTGLSRLDRFLKGVVDPVDGGAQLLTKMLPDGVVKAGNRLNNAIADATGLVARLPDGGVDQAVREREQQYQAQRGEGGFDGYRLLGNMLSPVNVSIARAIPAGATMGAKAALGATGGAVSSGLQPVIGGDSFAEEKAKQIAFGGATGAAMPAITAGLSRVLSPKASTNPDLALLTKEGVKPTIGQTLGGGWNRAEEKLMSMPVLGDAIAAARNRSREQFNTAAINRAVEPVGKNVSGSGNAAVSEAGDLLSNAYNTGKGKLAHFQIDQQGAAELANLRNLASGLPDKERRAFDQAWSYLSQEVSPNGSILADGFKRIDSKLGQEAARFGKSPDAYQQQAADAIKELRRIVTETAKRQNPAAAADLAKADKGWANLVRVEGAAKAAANTEGVFTPAQLMTAVRQADKSVRGRSVARGDALLQDLAAAGQNVLGNKVPNSGTTDRLLMGAGSLGGAYFLDPMAAGGLLGGAAMYSSPAQALLRSLVTARPKQAKQIAGLLQDSAPMLVPAGGLLALEVAK